MSGTRASSDVDRTASREIDSPLGALRISAGRRGLTELAFLDRAPRVAAAGSGGGPAERILDETERQLGEYFAGERRAFDVPLAASGTEFQKAIWNALVEIPYGATTSYGELARRAGRPGAVRAAGAANGANPIAVIVPCHRVIGADGSLTGYGGGLERKRALLALEGARLPGI